METLASKITSTVNKFSPKTRANLLAARKTAVKLRRAGFEAYLIGGAVRDILLGKEPKDFDLVSNITPEGVRKLEDLAHVSHSDAAESFGITRVKERVAIDRKQYEFIIEVATYRKDLEAHLGRRLTKVKFTNLKEDVKRRDITINALALDPLDNSLIDYVDGIKDLNKKIIRFIGAPSKRINEDPLRILRAIRFKNQLGFIYHHDTASAITDYVRQHQLLNEVSVDRVRDELTRMLVDSSRKTALTDLGKFGLLKQLIPELEAMKTTVQPAVFHAEGTVWSHTLLAMDYLKGRPSPRLAWGVLLHDVAKPITISQPQNAQDRIRFNRHSEVGAELAAKILKRFNFSKRTINDISWMIRYHLGIDDLPRMRPAKRAAIFSHPAFEDLFKLHEADAHAAWALKNNGKIDTGPADFSELKSLWQAYKYDQSHPPKTLKQELGIDGNWLKRNFNFKSPRQLGRVLEELKYRFAEGEIRSKDDARQIVRQLLSR